MTDAAFGCNPGLIPRLLGYVFLISMILRGNSKYTHMAYNINILYKRCAGEGEDCQSGSWGCALLSLIVSVLASVAVVFLIYAIFIFR